MDEFEVGGRWWLPHRPDSRVPGVLKGDAAGHVTLSLIGELTGWLEGATSTRLPGGSMKVSVSQPGLHRRGVYPRIVGRAEGAYYTLEDCLRTRHSTRLSGVEDATETILVERVFRGVGFDEHDRADFDRASIVFQWLTPWVAESGLEEEITVGPGTSGKHRASEFVLRLRNVGPRKCRAGDGWTVKLEHMVGIGGEGVEKRSLTQGFSFYITAPERRPLNAIMDVAADLQALVSIGTARTAGYESVAVFRPDIDRRGVRMPVEVIAEWQARDTSERRAPDAHSMPFTLKDFGGVPAVGRWLRTIVPYRDPLRRVMATKHSRSMYVSDRLLNRAAALEAFDRVTHKNGTFSARVTRCADVAGDPFRALVHDVPAWVALLRAQRNDAAHALGGSATSPSDALWVADAAYWLFVLCLLRIARAPRTAFDHMTQCGEFRHLSGQLRDSFT